MGMIRVQMLGSFPRKEFETCAIYGGHVSAIKRTIEFLTDQLGPAVIRDVKLDRAGVAPPKSPLGKDSEQEG